MPDLPEHPLEDGATPFDLFVTTYNHQLDRLSSSSKKFYDAAKEPSIKFMAVQFKIFIQEEGLIQPPQIPRLSDEYCVIFILIAIPRSNSPPLCGIEELEIESR